MAKNTIKNTEKKKKVPFSALRKGIVGFGLAGVMLTTPFMLAGCGADGKNGSTWYTGVQCDDAKGVVGDFFFDTDDYDIYQKTENGWSLISNIKGAQGEVGPQGSVGQSGLTPYIGANNNWWIGETDTSISAKGEDGKTPTIAVNANGYWVINDQITEYKANLSISEIKSELDGGDLVLKAGNFVKYYETATEQTKYWTNTTSTFSGWGGTIGKPEKIDTIKFKVRARDTAITQIKVFLTEGDKNGELIHSEILDVNVMPFEEEEIYVVIPNTVINDSDINYFFGYACNALCDNWGYYAPVEGGIPEDENQVVMAYCTSGIVPEYATDFRDSMPSSPTDKSPYKYQVVEIGTSENVFHLSDATLERLGGKIDVNLPEEYNLTVGDNFQLFYRGVVQAVNPYGYHIVVDCSKGSAYPRYFEWTPTTEDVGSYDLTISVYDDAGNLLGEDKTKLTVNVPMETNDTQNVLCIGDSLTAAGTWVTEAYRRFTQTGGTPEGLGYDYLNFVGTVKKTVNDKEIGFEGYGGWTWQKFCSEDSPFWDAESGDISFAKYCETNSIEDLDVVYFLLTWNGQAGYNGEYSVDTGHFFYARKMIEKLHEEFPNAVVRCMGIQMPSQNGGMGTNYGATGGYSDAYGMLKNAMAYNKTLEEFCNLDEYKDFVKYVDVAGQFDTDYNMPAEERPVNNRNDETEIVGTNGVHPSTAGYNQIADAAFRSLCEIFAETENS